jgi:hypothetical protein
MSEIGKPLYDIVYKCLLCERISRLGNPIELEKDQLPQLLGKIVANQKFFGHPILHKAPMQVPCKCSDGSAGLAYLAGIAKV